jgi:hypothetical protein
MLKWVWSKEDPFFVLFDELAIHVVRASEALLECLNDPSGFVKHAERIREIEQQADAVAHTTLERLHRSFITPFDRNDIRRVVQALDDVVDLMNAVSERLVVYAVYQVPSSTIALAQKSQEAVLQVQRAVGCFRSIRHSQPLRDTCLEIHRIENESAVIFREAITELFRDENDPKILLGLKDINEMIQRSTKRCEHLAHLIEDLVLEYA